MSPWVDTVAFAVTLIFMLVGLFGLIIPIFPGMLVMWISAFAYGLITRGFDTLGIVIFILISLLAIAGMVVDNILMGAGARVSGAAWLSIIVALAAGFIGTFLLPPIGGLIAAPLAVLGLEYLRRRDWAESWRATRGLMLGWGLSFLVRFAIGLLMIALWLIWVFAQTG